MKIVKIFFTSLDNWMTKQSRRFGIGAELRIMISRLPKTYRGRLHALLKKLSIDIDDI